MRSYMIIFIALILAFLALGLGSAHAKNNIFTYGNFNGSTTGQPSGEPCVDCVCGSSTTCHPTTGVDWIAINTNKTSNIEPGEHILFNMTFYLNEPRTNSGSAGKYDDDMACFIGIGTDASTITDPVWSDWTVVSVSADGYYSDLGYNLVIPWTTDAGITGINRTCEWVLQPNQGGSYDMLGMFRYGVDVAGDVRVEGIRTYVVNSGVPEFPLGLVMPFGLFLLTYALLRRQLIEERT